MKRRRFLKASALAGLSLAAPLTLATRDASAEEEPYAGPFWVFINAQGGWDPMFHFDPTINSEFSRIYTTPEKVGNISCAPIDLATLGAEDDVALQTYTRSPRQFLERFGSRLTVINGINTKTNNHDVGQKVAWSGQLVGSYPALGALIAAERGPSQPMAFLSAGGYDATLGLVPLTRVVDGDSLVKLARPNAIAANDAESDLFHTSATYNRILAAQRARLDARLGAQGLPKLKRAMSTLKLARSSDAALSRLDLPDELIDLPGGNLSDLERMMQQAQIALAAFDSGIGVSATLRLGGFDSHGSHDTTQPTQIMKLLGGIDFLMSEAERMGLADELVVVVGSDFGRGPAYNGTNGSAGKDHWPVTSMFAMGRGIAGDRVVGGTDDAALPRRIDPGDLSLVTSGGIEITPDLVHASLRKLAALDSGSVADRYPLSAQALPLFG